MIVNGKSQVTVCVTDGKNSAYKNYNETEVTLKAGKTCNIPSNTYAVFLDDDRTIEELSNSELTQELKRLKETSLTLDQVYPVGSIYTTLSEDDPNQKFGGTWERLEDGRMLKNTTEANNSGKTGGHNSVTLAANQIPTISSSGTTSTAGGHNHSVSGNTGWISADHTHTFSGTTGWMNQNWSHSHSVGFSPLTHGGVAFGDYKAFLQTASAEYASMRAWNDGRVPSTSSTDTNHTHNFSGTTSGVSSNHYHYFSATSSTNGDHNHTVTTTYTNNNQQTVSVQNKYITVYMWKRVS